MMTKWWNLSGSWFVIETNGKATAASRFFLPPVLRGKFPSFRRARSAAPLNLIRKILVTVAIKSIGGQ